MAKKRRKAPSPAQIAARKKFAAKYGGKKRRKAAPAKAKRPSRRRSRRRSAVALGKHRPVVIRRKGGYYRPKRSKLPKKMTLKNPFLGNLAIIGGSNPMAKRRRKSSHRRKHSRRSRGLALRNPISSVLAAPREMVRKDFLTEAASVAAGFVLPNVIMPRLPMSLRDSMPKAYLSKVAVVAGLAGAASLVNKRISKAILLGGGVSILLDAWTDFVAPAIMGGAGPLKAFYGDPGDPGVGAFYGDPGDPGVGSSVGDAFGGEGGGESW